MVTEKFKIGLIVSWKLKRNIGHQYQSNVIYEFEFLSNIPAFGPTCFNYMDKKQNKIIYVQRLKIKKLIF